MMTLLWRLKLPFWRRTHQNTRTKTSPIQHNTARPLAAKEDDSDDIKQAQKRHSPSPLPLITDFGSPAAHRYENEDIFWNSTMIEADSDPEKYQARNRRQNRRSASQDSLSEVGPDITGHAKNPGPGSIRAEIKHNSPNTHRGVKGEAQQRPMASNNLARRDTNITVVLARLPAPPFSPPRPPAPQKPITPSAEEWDTFMDFPSEYSMHIYSDPYGSQCTVIPKHTNGETATTATSTNTNSNHLSPSSATQPNCIQNGTSEAPPKQEKLTWNIALHQILEHDCVDPITKQIIRERIRGTQATNGTGDGDNETIPAVAAGLVPNFSYPIAGSAFYERILVDYPRHHPLSNGMTGPNKDDKKQEIEAKLTNGSNPNNTSRRHSTETDLDESNSASTLSSEHPDRVFFLLSSQLTPSELSLHHRILNIVPPIDSPPFPSTTPHSNASSPMPRGKRLICKLHDTIEGLQDRVSGLEDALIPQLSIWLDQKSIMVENLKVDIAILNTEIVNLKRTIDFGNRVLGGCWEREGELWHTLNKLRVKRSKRFPGRWTRRSRDTQNGRTSDANTLNGFNQRIFSSAAETVVEQPSVSSSTTPQTTTSKAVLSKGEINALFDISTQNIRILKEDINEMVALVQGCKAMAERVPEVHPVLESSRGV